MSDPAPHFAPLRPVSRIPQAVATVTGLIALALLAVAVCFLIGAPS